MSSKKGSKRKEDTTTKRGKKKLRIDGNESSSEDLYVPPGFARIRLSKWVLRARQHELDKTNRDRSNQGTHQAAMSLRRSTRLGSLSEFYANNPEKSEHTISRNSQTNKSSDLASNGQSALFNNSPEKEPVPMVQPTTEDQGRAHSITLTEVARAGGCNSEEDEDEVECPALVTVASCRVKEAFAPTARIILNKHGDILAGSLFEGTLQSDLFEKVCGIYQKLEKLEFAVIKRAELVSMKKDVRDLLKVNVDVGWLAKRLDEIHYAKDILLAAPKMKEERIRKQERISELEKEAQWIQKELKAEKEEADKIRSSHIQAKNVVMLFHKKSLVEGI